MKKKANVMMLIEFLFAALLIASGAFIWDGAVTHAELDGDRMAYEELQSSYYSVAAEVRNSAPADSPLTQQYAKMMSYPTVISTKADVATGKILTGIYFMLLAVLVTFMMMLGYLKKLACKQDM